MSLGIPLDLYGFRVGAYNRWQNTPAENFHGELADLQAEAAAKNLLAELNGQAADATFKVELICIVDSNDKGMLIRRTESNNIMLPGSLLFHWMKRLFEWSYLRKYR